MNPPPPPPHGESPKSTSGLPPGNYDIFIIPPHAAGSGFLYLPSLQPNVNSFAAGFASALILVVLWSIITPAVQQWWNSVKGSGGMGMILIMVAIGVGAWALGRIQSEGGPGPGGGGSSTAPPPGGSSQSYANGQPNGHANAPPPNAGPQPGPTPGPQSGPPPRSSWQQRGNPPPGASTAYGTSQPDPPPHYGSESSSPPPRSPPPPRSAPPPQSPPPKPAAAPPPPKPTTAPPPPKPAAAATPPPKPAAPQPAATPKPAPSPVKTQWEKAREETRRKEEERKAKEAEKKRREDLEKRLKEAREKDAKEREEREKKQKEKADAEKKAAAEKMAAAAMAARMNDTKPKGSSYAFSATGEKTPLWPNGPPKPPPQPTSQPASPTKKPPPPPTAKTYLGTEEDDAYSYRPYDKPKKPMRKKSLNSLYSESSYAASQSTSRTTPPPSHRGPYSTNDPNKIVIKAVYAFNNAFLRTPTSQLVSGVGSVTDGLILRITTEGLFIDDDVRGVPQREWDVKAWTMKLVEVWCPSFRAGPAAGASARASHQNPVRRLWNMEKEKAASSEETDALLADMLQQCRNNCSHSSSSSAYSASSYASSSSSYSSSSRSSYVSDSAYASSSAGSSSPSGRDRHNNSRTNNTGAHQTGELKSAGLHVLRASIRDQEGKRYLFVLTEEESWKVAVGLQRLRKGSQVRALGVSGMSQSDARTTLSNLGWD